jgi:hypothetical protein
MDESTVTAGLLMESIQAQGQHVDSAIERLVEHSRGLDAVVRQELRSAFAEEFRSLGNASERAAQALLAVRRAASLRTLGVGSLIGLTCSLGPLVSAWLLVPSRAELARLRTEREGLQSAIERLHRQGALVDLRRCGEMQRLCVRIDRSAPAYGEHAEYLILRGY